MSLPWWERRKSAPRATRSSWSACWRLARKRRCHACSGVLESTSGLLEAAARQMEVSSRRQARESLRRYCFPAQRKAEQSMASTLEPQLLRRGSTHAQQSNSERKIRQPLLAEGTKAAEIEFIVFLSISSHCYSVIRLCFYVFRGPKYPHICLTRSSVRDPVFLHKIVSFSSLFSRPINSEKRPSRHPNNTKKRSRKSVKTISMKSRFLQYMPCENPKNDLEFDKK